MHPLREFFQRLLGSSVGPSVFEIEPLLPSYLPHGVIDEPHDEDIVEHLCYTGWGTRKGPQCHRKPAIEIGDVMPPAAWHI